MSDDEGGRKDRRLLWGTGRDVLLRPTTIREKLTRVLLISLVSVLALLGVTVVSEVGAYAAAAGAESAVRLELAAQELTHEMQRERGLTNGLLGGDRRFDAELQTQRRRTDAARANLLATAGIDEVVRGRLDQTRVDVDAAVPDGDAVFRYYSDAIAVLDGVGLRAARPQDPELLAGLQALRAVGAAKEAAARERGFGNGIFAAGRFTAPEYLEFTEIRAEKQAGLAGFGQFATPAQHDRLDVALNSPLAVDVARYEQVAAQGADSRRLEVDPVPWWSAMTALIDDLRAVQASVGQDITARTDELAAAAGRNLAGFLALAALAAGGQVVLVVASSRSITRPLARLAAEADDVAARRLPSSVAASQTGADVPPAEPVSVPAWAGEEIRSAAAALDRVQQAAIGLASEQAMLRRNTTESLGHLGRRNRWLVHRQLEFISRLESDEPDPGKLDDLFELDHLAARLRRNARSLLVLAGQVTPRRKGTAMPMLDVIRGAVSEVEDYRRVSLQRVDDATVDGAVVSDFVHMLAELIENGLAASSAEVAVTGHRTSAGYLVTITDSGAGMSQDEIDTANARLRGTQSFLEIPARSLGHFVVGRLAAQSAVEADLARAPGAGMTARVRIPAKLLGSSQPHLAPPLRRPPRLRPAPTPPGGAA